MPQLPEDIIDRLNQMERRIKALSTAVNTRPPVKEIGPENPDATAVPTRPIIRIYDGYGHEIFSDDCVTGGLARPWLALMPPKDTSTARWPQTTSASFVTIARSFNPIWQPKLRLSVSTWASSGATGQVRIMVDDTQFGPTVNAGTTYDYTGLVPGVMKTRFGQTMKIEIQALATGGTVAAQPILIYGTQT
ncbi:hypothetical protein [Streptomyces sp. NPDC053431]|uniref:hypothetical protein n=1 Tax=Streptomyces sp. NPDC053431 TaxID=3365703 RepID=UPI0037D93F6D